MKTFDGSAVKAILFDVYGTLFEIGDKRAPFRQLIHIGVRQGRAAGSEDARCIMAQPLGLKQAAGRLGIQLTAADHARLESDLQAELASVAPFADTLPVLHALKQRGFKLGLCSNLALDYAAPVRSLLPFALDATVWSFDAGAIKPDAAIYAQACAQLGCKAGEVLMVGDTIAADVEGPHAFGMQALLLDRQGRSAREDALSSLSALCDLIAAPV